MKHFLLLAVLLVVPSMSHAMFVEDFYTGGRTEFTRPQPTTNLISRDGWPSWIGRLDDFSLLFFGRRYENLTRTQQVEVRVLSQEWPDWIGVPRGF